MPVIETWMWLVIAGVAVAAAILLLGIGLAVLITGRRKSARLRERFGPEYEQTAAQNGNRRRAEAELEARERRMEGFNIQPLDPEDRARFAENWQRLQHQFVDEPVVAVTSADQLVVDVMQSRGYSIGDFDQQAADLSVNYPYVVENYRKARAATTSNSNGGVSTEELRQAMQHYRSIFEELLLERERQEHAAPGK